MNVKRFFVIPILLIFILHTSFTNVFPEENIEGEFVVVLDAGHGGHDPGNLGNGYLEKNIALNIVLNVGSILERDPNVKVIYTRNDDTFVDLFVRGEIANKANADLFVSVHCDSHTSDAHGAGTFVLGLHANQQNFEIAKKENQVIYLEDNYESRYADYDINSPESVIGLTIMQEEFLDQSILLAKEIQDNFSNKLNRKNRAVKQAGFIVLHQTFMPSVLVETGFLTNDSEGAYLNSRKGQTEMGKAIANAIMTYKNGADTSAGQLSEQINMKSPNSEVKVKQKPEVDVVTNAEEQFAKNPSESPVVDTPDAQNTSKEVAELLKEKSKPTETNKTEVLKEKPKVVVETPVVKKETEMVLIKKPTEEAVVKETVNAPMEEVVEKPKALVEPKKTNIIFKVQLMASVKVIPLEASKFKGLNKLSKEPIKNMFRYMYGNVSSYKDALLLKTNADKKGYTTSYIVAYKDGVRIPTPEARKMVSE